MVPWFVLPLLALILFGVGFTLNWLWIIAAVVAVVWLIALLMRGVGRRGTTV
jgi:hypothetical protein